MDKKLNKNILAVRLYTGEQVIPCLEKAMKSTGKPLGIVMSGAGMMKEVKLGYFIGKGKYKENAFMSPREIVSLSGNFVNTEKKVYTHLHVSLADDEGRVTGGHLKEALVHGTGEIFLYVSNMKLTRKKEKETSLEGLKL
ncbi:PPC domain-containing DNA-binding protein [Elusimicrobiota bacterium]